MTTLVRITTACLCLACAACGRGDSQPHRAPSAAKAAPAAKAPKPDLQTRADALAHSVIIADTHVDVPYRLERSKKDGKLTEDVTNATENGDFDWPRATKGGLDAPFMSIYVPAKFEDEGGAKALADTLIDMVEAIAAKAPDKFALATSPTDVRRNFEAKKISLPMGMENGSPIEGKLDNVKHFRDRGIRYITLAHSKANHISDSSFDENRKHGGLSAFGKQVVQEMNRVGIMIDVSHLSDHAFEQVLEISKVPVLASHSSCRHFTPDWERNMGDAMIKKLAAKGGTLQINFGSSFINDDSRKQRSERREAIKAHFEKNGLEEHDEAGKAFVEQYDKEHPKLYATVEQVADHIDHVIGLVGIEHVGLGSDFDGVGDSLPTGLKDVSQYPNLIRVLLERGRSDVDIEKIASGNVLRVWQATEDYAAQQGNDDSRG